MNWCNKSKTLSFTTREDSLRGLMGDTKGVKRRGVRTLGAREHSRILTNLESLADVVAKLRIGGGAEVVVGLDVLLDCLTANGAKQVSRQLLDAMRTTRRAQGGNRQTDLLPLRSLS